jgi:hypothetical protein
VAAREHHESARLKGLYTAKALVNRKCLPVRTRVFGAPSPRFWFDGRVRLRDSLHCYLYHPPSFPRKDRIIVSHTTLLVCLSVLPSALWIYGGRAPWAFLSSLRGRGEGGRVEGGCGEKERRRRRRISKPHSHTERLQRPVFSRLQGPTQRELRSNSACLQQGPTCP